MRTLPMLLLSCAMLAQTPAPKLEFEVVSIKATNQTMMQILQSGGSPSEIDDAHLILRAMPLSALVQMAFHIPQDQITSPSWLNDVRFDVAAKLPARGNKSQIPEMMQSMLTARFGMKFHHEEKIRPVYLLTVGKGPLKIKPTAGGDVNSCNGGRGGHHTCQNLTMDDFAQFLGVGRQMAANTAIGGNSLWLDRPVIDKTGLQGAYDFSLDFGRVGVADGRRGGDAIDPDSLVPLSQAVKDLGFVLQPDKAPYDTVVIDHIEKTPTEN